MEFSKNIDAINTISEDIDKLKRKVKSKKRNLTFEDKVNAEFKHIKLRIKKLEQILLNGRIDNGSITDHNTKIRKG